MKKLSTMILIAAIAVAGTWFAPKDADAVPSFARQMQLPCLSCHFQYIPMLNSFGRNFKLGGMTDTAQDLIEDDGISLPSVGNVSFIGKYRYVQVTQKTASTPKQGAERGRWDIPDEAAIHVAGRMAENFGYAMEYAEGNAANNKVVFSRAFGDSQGGLVIGSTDGMGPAYGMELFNTGAVKGHRPFENRGGTLAQAVIGSPGYGSATLIEGFAGGNMYFLNVGLFGPAQNFSDGVDVDTGFDLSIYYRLAFTPTVGDWDLMIGVQGAAGETKGYSVLGATGSSISKLKTQSTVIDFQAQGELSGKSVQVVAAYITNPKTSGTTNYYNAGSKSESGLSLVGSLGFSPKVGVKAGFLSATDMDGSSTADLSAFSVGAWYNVAQNITVPIEYTSFSGKGRTDDSEVYLMLEFGW